MSMIARLRSKRVRSDSPVCLARSPGRPTRGSLHRAFSNGIGESLIEIKLKTQDDHVRTCVSELEGAVDASALEKYYHMTCLRSSQRTFTPVFHSNVLAIRTVCDEQLLLSI